MIRDVQPWSLLRSLIEEVAGSSPFPTTLLSLTTVPDTQGGGEGIGLGEKKVGWT